MCLAVYHCHIDKLMGSTVSASQKLGGQPLTMLPLFQCPCDARQQGCRIARSNNVGWTHGELTLAYTGIWSPQQGSGAEPLVWSPDENLLGFGAQRQHQMCFILRILLTP